MILDTTKILKLSCRQIPLWEYFQCFIILIINFLSDINAPSWFIFTISTELLGKGLHTEICKSLFKYLLIYDLVSNLTSITLIATRDLLAVVINQKYLFFLNEFIGFHIFWRCSTTEELTSFSSSFRLHLYIEDNNNFSSYMYVVNGCWKWMVVFLIVVSKDKVMLVLCIEYGFILSSVKRFFLCNRIYLNVYG